jgi:hypothetical protein
VSAGELLDWVQRKLPPDAVENVRPLRPVYYRLRAGLVAEGVTDHGRLRPSTHLEGVVPYRRRSDFWIRLSKHVGQKLPGLVPPDPDKPFPTLMGLCMLAGWLLVYAIGVPIVIAIEKWATALGVQKSWWFVALTVLLVPSSFIIAIGAVVFLVFYFFRNEHPWLIPAKCTTIADLVRFLAETGNDATTVPVRWTEARVWWAVRKVLAAFTGRHPAGIERDTILDDLEIGEEG